MPTNEQRRTTAKRKLERQIARRAEQAKRRRTIGVVAVVLAVLVVAGGVYFIATSGGDDKPQNQADKPTEQVDKPQSIPTATQPLPKRSKAFPAKVSCKYPKSQQPASKQASTPSAKNVSARGTVNDTLSTSVGEIPLTLDRSLAPCTVNSFVSLSKQGFFDQTPCHRLTTGAGLQVLQCGDPSGTGSGGPGYQFADETFSSLKYGRGLLAMANSGPDTNGSQFFIVYGDAQLPPQYTVFGSVDKAGLQVVDKVARAGAVIEPNPMSGQAAPGDGKPKLKVTITKATVQQ